MTYVCKNCILVSKHQLVQKNWLQAGFITSTIKRHFETNTKLLKKECHLEVKQDGHQKQLPSDDLSYVAKSTKRF